MSGTPSGTHQGQFGLGVALLGALNAPLDIADGIQVLREALMIGRSERALQARDVLQYRVENAAAVPDLSQPLGGAVAGVSAARGERHLLQDGGGELAHSGPRRGTAPEAFGESRELAFRARERRRAGEDER